MLVKHSVSQLVCIIPILSRNGYSLGYEGNRPRQNWRDEEWASWLPEQVRQSFPDAIFVVDPIRLAAGGFTGAHAGLISDPRSVLVLFDGAIGALVLIVDVAVETLTPSQCRGVYDALCTFQEVDARSALEPVLRGGGDGFDLTWSFAINILHCFKDRKTIDALAPGFRIICNADPGTFLEEKVYSEDYAMGHQVGTTGAMCVIGHDGAPKFSWRRVLGLWTLFYVYLAVSLADYARLSKQTTFAKRRLSRTALLDEIAVSDRNYNRIVARINVFDPVNICTRGFDESIYLKCWKLTEAESISRKLQKLSAYFIQNARESQGELTRRYEAIVQFALFVLAFLQMEPIVRDILEGAIGRGEAEMPAAGSPRLFLVVVSLLISLFVSGVVVLIARMWSRR